VRGHVKQYAPAHLVYVGIVVRSHPTQGVVEVRIQNGFEMDELHNVSAQSPSNNQGLFYNTSTSLWENKSIATALGYTPADDSLVVHLAGTETITGEKTFTNVNGTQFDYGIVSPLTSRFDQGIIFKKGTVPTIFTTITTNLYSESTSNNLVIQDSSSKAKLLFNNSTQTYTFPASSGTISLTSDLANYVDLTTAQTIGGTKTFTDATKNNGGIFLQNGSSNSLAGYMNLGGLTNGLKFTSGGGISNTFTLPSATGYTFTFPNATGTLALTSDLSGYLPLTGGTLTGSLTLPSNTASGNPALYFNYGANAASRSWRLCNDVESFGDFKIQQSTTQTGSTYADILKFTPTGGALFTSSVTLTGALGGTSASFSSTVTAVGYSKFWDATQGLLIGAYSGGAGFGAIYSTAVTPSAGNFALAASSGTTILNSPSGGTVALAVNSTQYLQVLSTGFTFFGSLPSVTSYIKYNFYAGVNQHIGFRSSGGIATLETTNDGVSANVPMQFAASQYTFGSGGNVQMGTAVDSGYRLDVVGTARFSGAATFSSTLTTGGKITANGGGLLLDLNGGSDTSSRVTGNRGNGDNLHIANIEFYNSFSSRLVGEMRGITGAGGTQSNSGQLAFYTNDNGTYAERMRITSGGNLEMSSASDINFGGSGKGVFLSRSGLGPRASLTTRTNITYVDIANSADWSGATICASGGNVLIGTTTDATGKLQVNGTIYATGFYESSDIRFKNILETNPNINLSGIDVIKFTRKDNDTNQVRYGYSAQQVQSILPDAVTGTDFLNVNYLDVHTLKIAALEQEIKELKAKMN